MNKQQNNFKIKDQVKLLDGRTGTITNQNPYNKCYYQVETYDYTGNKTYFRIFHKDMTKL